MPLFPCSMAIDATGSNVQAMTIDTDFHRPILVMGKGPAGSLVLRRQDVIETFTVMSVTASPQRASKDGSEAPQAGGKRRRRD